MALTGRKEDLVDSKTQLESIANVERYIAGKTADLAKEADQLRASVYKALVDDQPVPAPGAGTGPIVDPPGGPYPVQRNAKLALERLLEKGVTFDGRALFSPGELTAGVANLRRKVSAWCGTTIDLNPDTRSIRLDFPSFVGTESNKVVEALRRFRELQSADADLRAYTVGANPGTMYDPEGPIGQNSAPLYSGLFPTGGLQAWIDAQLANTGTPSGGRPTPGGQ